MIILDAFIKQILYGVMLERWVNSAELNFRLPTWQHAARCTQETTSAQVIAVQQQFSQSPTDRQAALDIIKHVPPTL